MPEDARIPNLERWLSATLKEPIKLQRSVCAGYSKNFQAWTPHMSCRVLDADLYNRLALAAGVQGTQWSGKTPYWGRLNDRDFFNKDGTPYWQQRVEAEDGTVNEWTMQPDSTVLGEFLRKYGAQHSLVQKQSRVSVGATFRGLVSYWFGK